MSNAPPSFPESHALETFSLELEEDGDVRGVVCFVEAWRHEQPPTAPALLAQARALLALGLVDHAWLRIQHALGQPDHGVEADVLAIEACMARGWNRASRALLDHALEHKPNASALLKLQEDLGEPASVFYLPTVNPSVAQQLDDARRRITIGEQHAAMQAIQSLDPDTMTQSEQQLADDLLWGQTTDSFLSRSLSSWVWRHESKFKLLSRKGKPTAQISEMHPTEPARPADWSKNEGVLDDSATETPSAIRVNKALLRLLPALEKEDESRVQLLSRDAATLEPDPTTEVREVSLNIAREGAPRRVEIFPVEDIILGNPRARKRPDRRLEWRQVLAIGKVVLLVLAWLALLVFVFAWLSPLLPVG
jgi:hypothetical protein